MRLLSAYKGLKPNSKNIIYKEAFVFIKCL